MKKSEMDENVARRMSVIL